PRSLGREFNRFEIDNPSFQEILLALRRKDDRKIVLNVGLHPKLGKYYNMFCNKCRRRILFKKGKKDLDGTRLMFDPFFYRNDKASPVLKTKREDVKDISAIFITHGHFDHATDAAWYAENLDVPVYCCAKTKQNMIDWAEGKILESYSHPLSEKGKNNINIIEFGDKIKISDQIEVEAVKSRHIKFDKESIHHVVLFPGFESVKEIQIKLKPHSKNILDEWGGRPRVNLSPAEIIDMIDDSGGIGGPAHAFTPFKAIFRQNKFETLKGCYEDSVKKVYFIELGLSA
ncbi:unnamed protein product, partial [marine sediment metagenome]